GWGCFDLQSQVQDFNLRLGPMWVDKLPAKGDDLANFMKTKPDPDTALVCPGDSGGATFVALGLEGSPVEVRVMVALGVAVELKNKISRLASLTTDTAREFIAQWSQSHGVLICGFHDQMTDKRCRKG